MKRSLLALTLLIGLAAPDAPAQVVDGNLADLIALAQADQADPINEILPNCKSGFDVEHVYVYYKFATDQLFVGIDLMDVPPGSGPGFPGPGVPGDADGDENPDVATNPACPEVAVDQVGVGIDEEYLIRVDTNLDGSFDSAADLRILYRGNAFSITRGDGSPAPGGISGTIKLGTAGAPLATGIPDADENRFTEDIELVVNNYSLIDPIPNCFRLDTFSGSLVDIPPEDVLNTPITFVVVNPATNIEKTVANVTRGTGFAETQSVAVGDTVRFRLVVSNTGDVRLDPYVIQDTIPAGLTFVPGSVVGANVVQFAAPVLTLKQIGGLTNLDPGQTRNVTFDCTVNVGAPLSMVNSATAGGNVPVSECGDLSAQDTDTAALAQIDIECVKTVSLDGVVFSPSVVASPGQLVQFRVVIQNNSGVAFEKVTFTDTLPAGFSNVVSMTAGCGVVGNTVSCANLGPLGAGASVTVNYRAKVIATSGPLVNTAHVEGFLLAGDVSPADVDECSATVNVGSPCIECEKEVSLDGVNYFPSLAVDTDQVVAFRVTVRNCGNVSLFTVSLADTLPAGFAEVTSLDGRCGAAGNTISCAEIGPLAPAASTVVRYRARVVATNPPTASLTNTAVVSGVPGSPGNPGTPVGDNCSSTVNPRPCGLECDKKVSANGVNYTSSIDAETGDTIFFRIEVTNSASAGGCTFATVSLTDPLPATVTFKQFESVPAGDACNFNAGTKTVSCTIVDLSPGETHTVIFSVTVNGNASGQFTNSASVEGSSGSPGNPGRTYSDLCSATVRVKRSRVPTNSEWGLLLLASLLGVVLVKRARREGSAGLSIG